MAAKRKREAEVTYSAKQTISKPERLIRGIRTGKQFTIHIAGERIRVPKGAQLSIAHEREKDQEEIEFQLTWKVIK